MARRENKTRRRGRLAALARGLGHEIRNPLSAMSINLQMLREDLEGTEEARERRHLRRVELLEREVSRLEKILDDFHHYARIQLEPVRHAVNPLLREIVELWAPKAKEDGIEVELVLAPDLPDVVVDTTYFHKAVLNLLLNAQQAIVESDERRPGHDQIVLGSRRAKGAVEVLVIDTGPGIPEERLREVFEPFYSTKRGGTGLGLSTSRRILEELGGTLTVESEVGRGTSFRILLPDVSDEAVAAVPPAVAADSMEDAELDVLDEATRGVDGDPVAEAGGDGVVAD